MSLSGVWPRQLPHQAIDGASAGVDQFIGDLHRDQPRLSQDNEQQRIIVLARNTEAADALTAQLSAVSDLNVQHLHIVIGRLTAGWRDLESGQLVIHDFELLHRRPVARRQKKLMEGNR